MLSKIGIILGIVASIITIFGFVINVIEIGPIQAFRLGSRTENEESNFIIYADISHLLFGILTIVFLYISSRILTYTYNKTQFSDPAAVVMAGACSSLPITMCLITFAPDVYLKFHSIFGTWTLAVVYMFLQIVHPLIVRLLLML